MFRPRLAAALAVAVLTASPAAPLRLISTAEAQMDAARVPLVEFKKLHDAGKVLVVDTRDAESYRVGHIPGAILVPASEVPAKLAEVKAAGKPVVTYCT